MKIMGISLMAAIVLGLSLAGCGEEPPPVPQKQVQSPKPVAKQPEPKVVPTPPVPPQNQAITANSWPFQGTDEQAAELAENVMVKNYMLIFDGSGSMDKSECSAGRRKIDVAKESVVAWSKSIPEESNLGLYAFHKAGRSNIPLSAGNRDRFIQTIHQIRAGGKTPLSEAMAHADQELTKQGRRQLGYGEYTIVVVTDGIADSTQLLSKRVAVILRNTPITIYSIGFCIGENHSLNQPGQTIYKAADNPEQLRQGLQTVLAESETFDDSDFNN